MSKRTSKFLTGIIIGVLCAGSMPALAAENSINVQVNGKKIAFSNQKPQVISGVTYVPLRGVFEEMGYEVWWIPSSKIITLDGENQILLYADSRYIMNAQTKYLKNKILTIKGTTMLPLREVSALAGAEVIWDAKTNTVLITTSSNMEKSEEEPSNVTPNHQAKDKAQPMHSFVEIMEKRKENLKALNSKYGLKIYPSDIKKEDRENYIEAYKKINSENIAALEAIQADEDFTELKSKTIELLDVNARLIEDFLMNDTEIDFVVQMTKDRQVKDAIMAYCKKKGLSTRLFYNDIEEKYGQTDVVRFF